MADKDTPLREVQVEALVIMRIIKHSTASFPTTATGALVGMDIATGQLQVTNSFPYPTPSPEPTADSYHLPNQDALAAAAPRAKSNAGYQTEMIKMMREVNVDAQSVGWYTSTSMGNFVNQNFVENQYHFQKQQDERSIALVFDVSRSSQGGLSLKAYRLSPAFMAAYKEGKFSTESIQKSALRYQDLLSELPVRVHNSHLLTSFLHQLPASPPTSDLDPQAFPSSLNPGADPFLTTSPLVPNLDSLDLSLDPFLEKSSDLLLQSIEDHHTELNNAQYYQRSLARENVKIQAWQTKRKAENAARTASKQPLLPEDEWKQLFKLPTEPSRLEALLVGRQVEQYARQVDGFSAVVSAKMFSVRGNMLPGEMN